MKIENLKLKIVFFGTPDFVNPVLEALKENFDVVKTFRTPQQWNNAAIEQLKNLNADFFVVASFGQILPKKILEIPRLGAINTHPSLLPKYRGPSPIQAAILNGDKKTGVTFIKMDQKMDHGPIIEQFEEPILKTDTFESLANRLFKKAADTLVHVITRYNETELKPQDHSKATYTKLLTRENGYINLSEFQISNFKFQIDRMVRAYFPWPGAWTRLRLNQGGQAKIVKLLPSKQIQVEGKKEMSYKDFLNGYPNADLRLRNFLEQYV